VRPSLGGTRGVGIRNGSVKNGRAEKDVKGSRSSMYASGKPSYAKKTFKKGNRSVSSNEKKFL